MRFAALLSLPLLALLLLAAHLVHAGAMPLAALAILLAGLLAVPHPWAARALQVVLAVAVTRVDPDHLGSRATAPAP